jgi:hypothetical protein
MTHILVDGIFEVCLSEQGTAGFRKGQKNVRNRLLPLATQTGPTTRCVAWASKARFAPENAPRNRETVPGTFSAMTPFPLPRDCRARVKRTVTQRNLEALRRSLQRGQARACTAMLAEQRRTMMTDNPWRSSELNEKATQNET